MSVEGKGPVSQVAPQRSRWLGRLNGIGSKPIVPQGIIAAKCLPLNPAERMMTSPYSLGSLRMERVKLPAPNPADGDQIGPQHLVTEDIEGSNPKGDAAPLRMGPFERTAHLAAPRRMGLLQQLFFFELWHAPKAPLPRREEPFRITADADVRQTRAPRLLAMVMKVLKFDVSAWLRGK